MPATSDRPHIRTINEQVGMCMPPDDEGGAWCVFYERETRILRHIFSNRAAAEAYIYDAVARAGHVLSRYEIEVWAISDTWPDEEED